MVLLKLNHFSLVSTIVSIILLQYEVSAQSTAKICSQLSRHQECEQLARNGKLACLQNFHSVDCILNIDNGVSHLGLLRAEEALLAAPFVTDNVVVIGTIKKSYGGPYQTVVVVKSDYHGGFEGLQKKKYCHPGFKNDPDVTKLVLEEFEYKIVNNTNDCDTKMTLVERHVKALSSYFESACRPGLWTEDIELDRLLKSKYSNLCKICGSLGCNVDYKAPFNDSASCFTANDADVVVTTLANAQSLNSLYPGKYKLLCKSGTTTGINLPCTWTHQLFDVIIANKQKAYDLKNHLHQYFVESPSKSEETYKTNLMHILEMEKNETMDLINIQPLKTHVSQTRSIPKLEDYKMCGTSMRWCTKNNMEQAKCEWLRQASLNQGIQPVVECVVSENDDDLSCIADIEARKSDAFTLSTNYAYAAAKQGLTSIAYPETDTRYLYGFLIVLNDDSPIKSFKDLQFKSSCMPQFGGKEMFAFISFIQDEKIVKRNSDFGVSAAEFLGDSCLPGVKGFTSTILGENDQEKLCAKCIPKYNNFTAKYCNADNFNKYYGNDGALQCLKDRAGDFAVVTSVEIDAKLLDSAKVICKNGSIINVQNLKVDEDCALSVIVASEVVSRPTDNRNEDYVLALREFENIFAEQLNTPFQLFNRFNETKDLLFKDSTPGLLFTSSDVYIENLKHLIASINKSGSASLISTLSMMLIPIIYLYIFK